MQTQTFWLIFISVFLLANLISFAIMLADKSRAKKQGASRISEGDLFFLSICFGSLGVLLGMKFGRHKTRKFKFIVGVPLALVQNVVLLWFIVNMIMQVKV